LKYELLGTRKTSEQKYYHVESLRALGRVYDVGTLLGNLGWLDYVEMKCKSHNQRVIELLSYWAGSYRDQEVLITFHMFSTDHQVSLRGFNELLTSRCIQMPLGISLVTGDLTRFIEHQLLQV